MSRYTARGKFERQWEMIGRPSSLHYWEVALQSAFALSSMLSEQVYPPYPSPESQDYQNTLDDEISKKIEFQFDCFYWILISLLMIK